MNATTNTLAALITVLTLTAFAPAPLPRAKRERGSGDEINLKTFQGSWRVVSMQRTSRTGKHSPHNWQITHIRISDDRWTFMANATENTSYRLKIDGSKKPGLLDYYSDTAVKGANNPQSSMVGIIRRAGNRVEILYLPGNHQKPTTFDPPPEGWWLLILQKEG